MTGRESRLPLRIRGDGTGPQVHFSLDTLDIGNVFINSQHSYEVNTYMYFPHPLFLANLLDVIQYKCMYREKFNVELHVDQLSRNWKSNNTPPLDYLQVKKRGNSL